MSVFRPRVHLFRLLLVACVGGTLLGCGAGGGHSHDDKDDAGADASADGDTKDASQGDGSGTSSDAGAVCEPACASGQVCCTDQHGHFPTCITGTQCP